MSTGSRRIRRIYAKDTPGILIAWLLRVGTHPSRTHVALYTHLSSRRSHSRRSFHLGRTSFRSSWSDGIDSTAKARSGRRESGFLVVAVVTRKGRSRRANPANVNAYRHTRERLESRFDLSFPLSRPRFFLSSFPLRRVLHRLRTSVCRRSDSARFRARTRATSVNQ